MSDPALLRWRKSSRSGSQSNCIEIASSLDRVRDSKNPAGVVLQVTPAALAAFLGRVRHGTFDS